MPLESFSIVSPVAGASRVGRSDFLLGTAVGIAPMIVLAVIFVSRVRAVLSEPGPASYFALGAVVVVAAAVAGMGSIASRAGSQADNALTGRWRRRMAERGRRCTGGGNAGDAGRIQGAGHGCVTLGSV